MSVMDDDPLESTETVLFGREELELPDALVEQVMKYSYPMPNRSINWSISFFILYNWYFLQAFSLFSCSPW